MSAREFDAISVEDVVRSADIGVNVPGYSKIFAPEVDREVADSINEDGLGAWTERTDVL